MDPSIDRPEEKLQLAAEVETRHKQPDICAIYEPDSDGNSKMARWITAKGDAFVDAETIR